MFELKSARHWAHALLREKIQPGMTCIDATMGNGHDAKLLCELVGESGRVFAFDVQRQALDATRALLASSGLDARATLILDGHERMERHIATQVDACAFNLGWLPGGDKAITTRLDTTIAALNAALRLLNPTGLTTVCAYPGHDEGNRERDALLDWAGKLDCKRYQARLTAYLNQPANTPLMIAVTRIR